MSRDMSAYGLTDAVSNLFSTEAERQEEKLPRIHDIPLSEIDPFPDHPFQVRMDGDMEQLIQSIREQGVITPVTLRPKEDGRYEIVSGHRRCKACELLGLESIRAELRELSLDEAILLMVESNFQRSMILPSERAFAYKMKLEAMNRKAGRPPKENLRPVGTDLSGQRTDNIMASEVGDSARQIHRYIRLTELEPPLLKLVDEGRIAFRPAVELSYLTSEEQNSLLETISYEDATPSLAQAQKMRRFSKEGRLNEDVILSILSEQKGNQIEKLNLRYDKLQKFIPKDYSQKQAEEHIFKALEHYHRYLQRQRSDRER